MKRRRSVYSQLAAGDIRIGTEVQQDGAHLAVSPANADNKSLLLIGTGL